MSKSLFFIVLVIALPYYTASADSISFIAFGDSGYHYDYLDEDDIETPQTKDQYIHALTQKRLKQYHAPDDIAIPPLYNLPGTPHYVEKSGQYPVAKAMTTFCQKHPCEFALLLGDNIYPSGATGTDDALRFKKVLEEPYQDLGKGQPQFKLYAALGNHDWKTSRIGVRAQIDYANKKQGKFYLEAPGYYTFTRGNAQFFVLDTNLLLSGTHIKEDKLNPDGSEKRHNELDSVEEWEKPIGQEKQQLQWLKKSLKGSKAEWKVVYGHHTLWSSGGTKFEQAHALRAMLLPMLCHYADMYFSGHEHDLEVHTDTCQQYPVSQKPLPIVVSGAGSKQRPIHKKFQAHQKKTYPSYREIWLKGMTWGFTHITLNTSKAIVTMVSTPNDGHGVPKVEKQLVFDKRF